MDITAYRKAYFALCRKLGIVGPLRYDFNEAQTGKESTRHFTVQDWRDVVAELQSRTGQNVQPGQPRIRSRRDRGGDDGNMITPAQLEFLTIVAAEIEWRVSLESFIRARLLSPLRKANWNGSLETLFRSEAANVITTLKNMTEKRCGTCS